MRLPELAGVTRTIISSVKPIQRLLWLASIRPAGLSDATIVQPIRWAASSARANATSGASPTVSGTTWISCCTFAPARAGVGFSMLPVLRCRSCAGATPRCPVPIRPHRRFTGVHGWPDLGLTMKPDYVIERRAADHSANIGSRKHRFATDSPLEGDGFELPVPRAMQAGLRRKSSASAACRRRLSGAAGAARDKRSVPRFRFAP